MVEGILKPSQDDNQVSKLSKSVKSGEREIRTVWPIADSFTASESNVRLSAAVFVRPKTATSCYCFGGSPVACSDKKYASARSLVPVRRIVHAQNSRMS